VNSDFEDGTLLRTFVRNSFASKSGQHFHDNPLPIVFCHNLLIFANFRFDFVLFRIAEIGVNLTANLTPEAIVLH
jgi:hypothetical protein